MAGYKKRSLLFFNGGLHAVAQGVRTFVTLITIPLLFRYLGKDTFGLWMIALSFISMIGFIQGGISGTMINIAAKAQTPEVLAKRVSGALYTTILIATLILPLGLMAAYYIPWRRLFQATDLISQADMVRLLFVLFGSFCFSIVSQVPKFVLIGDMKAYLSHSADIIATIISGLAVILAIYFKQPLWVIAFAFSFGREIPLLILGLGLLKWRLKLPNFLRLKFDKDTSTILFKSGALLMITQAAFALANHSDLTLIGIYGDLSDAGDYAIMQRVFAIPMMILIFVSLALWPAFSKAKMEGSIDWISRIFLKNIFLLTSFAILFGVSVALSINPLLTLWLGETQHIDPLLVWGMVGWIIITVPIGMTTELFKSLDKFRSLAILSVLMVSLNVPVSIYLIKIHGAAGAILGTLIANIVFYAIPFIFMVPILFKEMRLQAKND